VNPDCSTWTAQSLSARPETGRSGLRSALVTVVGGLLVAVGLVGLFLPLPGIALILMGLSMLSTRFALARRWLESVQRSVTKLRSLRR
jgi:uncharacterized membrane protein YbaN (DUF454 family)